jgi:hypothetical protein
MEFNANLGGGKKKYPSASFRVRAVRAAPRSRAPPAAQSSQQRANSGQHQRRRECQTDFDRGEARRVRDRLRNDEDRDECVRSRRDGDSTCFAHCFLRNDGKVLHRDGQDKHVTRAAHSVWIFWIPQARGEASSGASG